MSCLAFPLGKDHHGGGATASNNQLPPALTAFAPSTPGTGGLNRWAELEVSQGIGPSTVGMRAGRGNFERYARWPQSLQMAGTEVYHIA
jgi:hypothetical protein